MSIPTGLRRPNDSLRPRWPFAVVSLLALSLIALPLGSLSVGASAEGFDVVVSPVPHQVVAFDPAGLQVRVTLDETMSADTLQVLVDGVGARTISRWEVPSEDCLPSTDVSPDFVAIIDDAVAAGPGSHHLQVTVGDRVLADWTFAVSGYQVQRLGSPTDVAGATLAQAGPDTVVAGRGADDDTFAALSLAGRNARVLTVDPDGVPCTVAEAIRAGVQDGGRVRVIGGTARVSAVVMAELQQIVEEADPNAPSVERFAGESREATAAVVAREQLSSGEDRPVVIAPARTLRTGLPAAVLAARSDAALLLASTDGLPDATRLALLDHDDQISSVIVVGADLVGGSAQTELEDLLGPDRISVVAAADGESDARAISGLLGGRWTIVPGDDPAEALAAGTSAVYSGGVVFDDDPAGPWYLQDHPAVSPLISTAGADVHDLIAIGVDGPQAPVVSMAQEGENPTRLTFTADRNIDAIDLHVRAGAVTVPGVVTVDGATARWTASISGTDPLDVVVFGVLAGAGHQRHLHEAATITLAPPTTTSPEGYLVAGGDGPIAGSGPLRTFSVEIEPATGLDLVAVAQQVESILLDPRGWTAPGTRSLQRVGESSRANIRVVVARPSTVDRNCATVGLGTGGRLSCWDGRRANLNLNRWNSGVTPFHTNLEIYRTYLVSHEVGHGLGMRHVSCPGSGQLAPTMMQQSKGLGGCVANGWPYP